MDVNSLRIAVTVAGFVLFLLLVRYTWQRQRAADHAQAAQLPFMGEDMAEETFSPEPASNKGVSP